MKKLFLIFILIMIMLIMTISFSFCESKIDFSVEDNIYINGINTKEFLGDENILLWNQIIYLPIDIEFLGHLGIFPMWNSNFTKLTIDGGKSETSFNNIEENNYYIPLNRDLINNLGWVYYDYKILGKFLYTRIPSPEDEKFVKDIVSEGQLLSNYMRIINKKLSKEESDYYELLVRKASNKYEIDKIWILAMMWQESNYDKSCEYKGAIGLMQMLVSTGKTMGISKEDMFKPEISIEYGVKYLRADLDHYDGDLEKAILAYNQGSVRVDKGIHKTWYFEQVKEKYEKIKKYIENNKGEE